MRNSSVDLYRCLLMFGICLLHSMTQGGHNVPWVANTLYWCVTGFVFISGWYGIRFSFRKVLKLYSISLYCAVMFVILELLVTGEDIGTLSNILRKVWIIAIGHWYVNAYVILMCFAPMVNTLFNVVKSMSTEERKRS